jgi:hypothetical protein
MKMTAVNEMLPHLLLPLPLLSPPLLLPPLSWFLSVPYRLSTLTYRHESKAKSRMCYHVLPCVPRFRTPPPN